MTREFSSFEFEILNKPFFQNEVLISEQTVKLQLYNSSKQLPETIELAYIKAEQLYVQIHKSEMLWYENVWISDFSLQEYRKIYNHAPEEYITIENLHITNSFFYNQLGVDFSRIHASDKIFFKNVNFLHSVSFEHARFDKSVNFDYAHFFGEEVNFNDITCQQEEKSFKNAVFRGKLNKFEKINWGTGDVIFVNVEFTDGDLLMLHNTFGDGKKLFKLARFGNGRKDFNNTRFGNGTVSFEKADFGSGTLSFRNAEFGDADIDFTSSQFCNISFINTKFGKGDISFKNANFTGAKNVFRSVTFDAGKKDFHYAKFEKGDFDFENVRFGEGILDFRATEFKSCNLHFERCNFINSEIVFEAAEAQKSEIDIDGCNFIGGTINFEALRFADSELLVKNIQLKTDKVSFKNSTFRRLTLHSCELYKYVDLRVNKCQTLQVTDSLVDGILDLQPESGMLNVDVIDFSGMRLLGRIYIDWHQAHLKRNINQQHTDFRNKAEQFRMLKENYNQLGKYDEEDLAYLEFKRNEAKALLLDAMETKNLIRIAIARTNYAFKWMVFDKMGHYATDPVRVFQSMFIVYILFSFIFLITHRIFPDADIRSSLFAMDDPRVLSEAGRAFYHSIVTFLTIGYGDYYPTGFSRVLSGIEGFTGLFLLSYFTVAFVRKILR